MSSVLLYVALSQDGFIADAQGGVDWLPGPGEAADPEDTAGYQALLKRVGVLLMGRRTYDQILGFGPWAWPDHTTYVFTHAAPSGAAPQGVRFIKGRVADCLPECWAQAGGRDLWLLGGAELAHAFARAGLIDAYILTWVPTQLGTGIKLELPDENFEKVHEKWLPLGMMQAFWRKKNASVSWP